MNEIAEPIETKRIIIYACSGCSDAGELADRAARTLSQQKRGQMSCLAGIGGRVKSLMITAEKADEIVAIAGCPLNCARHTLERAGFKTVHHLELHKLGLRKGSGPPTEEGLAGAVKAGAELFQAVQNVAGNSSVKCIPALSGQTGNFALFKAPVEKWHWWEQLILQRS